MKEFELYLGPINGIVKVKILRKKIKTYILKSFAP